MRHMLAAVLLFVAGPAFANVARNAPKAPAKYVVVEAQNLATVANGVIARLAVPSTGRFVDAIVHQAVQGVGGTSYTIDIKDSGGTSLFATLPVQTLASGTNKFTDVKGEIALPSGWTRGVLAAAAMTPVTKGDRLNVSTVETGTYSTHATISVLLIFEALQ